MHVKFLPKKDRDNIIKINAAFLLVSIIWGAANPIIKFSLDYIPPFTFLFLRFLLIGIVVFPIIYFQLKKEPIHKEDYGNFFLLGLFSQTALALTFVGLKYTTSLDYTIIGIMSSVLTVYAGHYFYKDKINKWIKIGLLIASLGTFLIVLEPAVAGNTGDHTPLERIFGNILAVANALTWVVFIIWSKFSMGQKSEMLKKTLSFVHLKPMKRNYSPTTVIMITFYVALVTFMPLAIIENLYIPLETPFNMLTIDFRAVIGILYTSLLSSITAYWLHQWALANSKVSNAAIFAYLSPVFTVPFAYLILGELPNTLVIVGAALIAVGVILAEANNHDI